jgi:bifunctional DNA-binding transcriptional regulator/antitoxin component of YhaV-PrlF toxin-antitoxin module
MIRVKVSDQFSLQIPRKLSTQLALADGDQVEIVRQGDLIILQKLRKISSSQSLRDLAGRVKTSRPRASVDVSEYMTRKGYEHLGPQNL